MKTGKVHLREVLFEFTRVGKSLRVAAIDPVPGTEVIMVGAPGYGHEMLKRIAARKLAYVIEKNRKAAAVGKKAL